MKALLVLDEVLAMLDVVGVPPKLREKFKVQAEQVLARKVRRSTPDDGTDAVTVGSGYGTVSQRGFVELVINETSTQMTTTKAREIGLMLIEAAEAGVSDEIVMTLLRERVGITDVERQGRILIDLREIRQGARTTVFPS